VALTVAAEEPPSPVQWSTIERSYPVRFRQGRRPREAVDVTNVVLENRHLRIEVAPELAGRVMHVQYKADDAELFNVHDWIMAWNAWDAGGYRTSFPFYEHGMRFRGQTAGWRVVRGDDGSLSLTMDMRFARFSTPQELQYKGRFSHQRLGRTITLRPGQAYFECDARVENPLPYRLGVRLWSTIQFPTDRQAEFILPISRYCDHMGEDPSDWTPGEGKAFWRNWPKTGSVFSLNLQAPFVAVYYPESDVNRIRIADPKVSPGAKLYAWPMHVPPEHAKFFEFWTGLDRVFEQPGHFMKPFSTAGFAEQIYRVRGIGRLTWANRHVAVGLHYETSEDTGATTAIVRLAPAADLGEVVASATTGSAATTAASRFAGTLDVGEVREVSVAVNKPGQPVRVMVRGGKETWLDVTLPAAPPAPDAELERAVIDSIRPDRSDLRRWAEHSERRGWIQRKPESGSLGTSALPAARTLAEQQPDDLDAHLLLGRIALRLGELDAASTALRRALQLDPGSGLAHHLLGLTLWEQGRRDAAARQFRAACASKRPAPQAAYFVAMNRIAEDKRPAAVAVLQPLVRGEPEMVRPRLLLAALLAGEGRHAEARSLLDPVLQADPASVEAVWVASLAWPDEPGREAALEALLKDNPEADGALEQFRSEVDDGDWEHPGRPGPFKSMRTGRVYRLMEW
jgi:hypothetical protein